MVDMVFPGFYRIFVSTTGLESFSLRPEKFSKRFSFGGGCVRFFLLCAGRPHVPHFPFFAAAFLFFPVFCSVPGVDPHVPHSLWIEYEEN